VLGGFTVSHNDTSKTTLQALRRLVLDEVDNGSLETSTPRLILAQEQRLDASAFADTSLTAKVAMLENIVSRTHGAWEPDGVTQDEFSGANTQALSHEQVADATAPTPPQHSAYEQPVDTLSPEEMAVLRQMISGIIHEELSGAFGEAITANLRQLVRREIQTILAQQGLASQAD
jgi:hypothetical protein